jgi:hypothetical protein
MDNEHITLLKGALQFMIGDTERLDSFLDRHPLRTPSTTSSIGSQGSRDYDLKARTLEDFELTIPIGLALFSLAELFGYMINPSGDPYSGNQDNFNKFYELRIPKDSVELSLLWKVFRNGMSHNYFSKLKTSITYNRSVDKLYLKNDEGRLVLNVFKLKKITIEIAKNILDNSYVSLSILPDNYEKLKQHYSTNQTNIDSILNKVGKGSSI